MTLKWPAYLYALLGLHKVMVLPGILVKLTSDILCTALSSLHLLPRQVKISFCSGCVDHTGTHRPLNQEWKTDPCTTHVCTETGIQTSGTECQLGPAPHPSCYKYTPSGRCCPIWYCRWADSNSLLFRNFGYETFDSSDLASEHFVDIYKWRSWNLLRFHL